jgi:hypothetical protein
MRAKKRISSMKKAAIYSMIKKRATVRTYFLASWMVCVSTGALAQSKPAAAVDTSTPQFAAWNSFADQLRQLGNQILAKLPPRLRDNPQVQQEAGRLLLEAVATRTIDAIGSDGDHPAFLPASNFTLNIYQPNADTTYRSATITPGGSYRLRGERGSLRVFKLGQFGPTPAKASSGISAQAYNDFNTLPIDEAGKFDVIVSPVRPAGYRGKWWELKPGVTSLLLRQVDFDWAHEHDPSISIERLDKPVTRPRPDAAELEERLRGLATQIGNTAFFLLDHVEDLRRDGYINRLHEFDVSHLGGLVGQFYYEGAYELSPDDALILEAKVPDKCSYWSTILTNDIYETTDWYNNQSSLNGAQAQVDRDGVFRAVISAKDPGVPNWLDTGGYSSGAIQGRWNECSSTPIPSLRKVALADVRRLLPPETPIVTPDQREHAVRERRAQLQQRPLW